jgi:hypothetical protein
MGKTVGLSVLSMKDSRDEKTRKAGWHGDSGN